LKQTYKFMFCMGMLIGCPQSISTNYQLQMLKIILLSIFMM